MKQFANFVLVLVVSIMVSKAGCYQISSSEKLRNIDELKNDVTVGACTPSGCCLSGTGDCCFTNGGYKCCFPNTIGSDNYCYQG